MYPHRRVSQTHGTTYIEQNLGYEARHDSSFQSVSVKYDSKQASWVYQAQDSVLFGLDLPVVKQPINCRDFYFVQALVAPNGYERLPWNTSGPWFTTTHAWGIHCPSNVSQMVVWKRCQQPTLVTAWGSAPDFKSRDTTSLCPCSHARCKGVALYCT